MKVNKDRVAGIVFAILGLAIVLIAGGIVIPKNLSEPGPRLFPYISGGGIFLCGLGMALTKQQDESQPYLDRQGTIRLLKAAGLMVLYYMGLDYLGFLIATPLFMFAAIILLSGGKKINLIFSIVLSLATSFLLYFLFKQAFMIFLPAGKLF